MDERDTPKYRAALGRAIDLEATVTAGRYTMEYLLQLSPDALYEFLMTEWWLEWDEEKQQFKDAIHAV